MDYKSYHSDCGYSVGILPVTTTVTVDGETVIVLESYVSTVNKEDTIEQFRELPSIGQTGAERLYNQGYTSIYDIVSASALTINMKCGITVSNATEAISAAAELIESECPSCGQAEIISSNRSIDVPVDDTEMDVACSSCHWFGPVEALRTESEQ